ncbi:Gamma-tubulin complex component 2, partial [Sarracenia purpurea var. burkii]
MTVKSEDGRELGSFTFKDEDESQEVRAAERRILLEALANQLPPQSISFSSKLAKIERSESGETLLQLMDGTRLSRRWVYEGVIDDPYSELFIAENKSLPKESLSQDYDAKYWRQRYSLKDDIPSFLENAAKIILTTGKYLNVMRECGHNVQYDLMGKLRSIKHYLLHDQGDFLVHFMDIASDELSKKPDEISVEKLQ